jgi:hypothetical protein
LVGRLEALLITPIQRIPRYILLLEVSNIPSILLFGIYSNASINYPKDMLRNTPEDHPDNEKLKNAIPLMQSVADYINKDIKEAANMKKFLELSSQGAKVR